MGNTSGLNKPIIHTHDCVVAVSENQCAVLLKSTPNLDECGVFDGFYLDDNITEKKEDIPKEFGIYSCKIKVRSYSYWTGDGTEYDSDVWLEDVVKLDVTFGICECPKFDGMYIHHVNKCAACHKEVKTIHM